MNRGFILLSCLVLGAAGCRTGRYELEEPLDGRTLEVKSGDRISVVLDEKPLGGYVWMSTCDDPDITFARETVEPDKVRIITRVTRGFDGPAHVRLTCRQPWKDGKTARQIDLILYHLAEDKAPWRQFY